MPWSLLTHGKKAHRGSDGDIALGSLADRGHFKRIDVIDSAEVFILHVQCYYDIKSPLKPDSWNNQRKRKEKLIPLRDWNWLWCFGKA